MKRKINYKSSKKEYKIDVKGTFENRNLENFYQVIFKITNTTLGIRIIIE